MGNRCLRMMKQDRDDDDDNSSASGRSEGISSDNTRKLYHSFSSSKDRLSSAPSFSFSGCPADSSLSVKGPDGVPSFCNSELSGRDDHQLDETALSSTRFPCKQENLDVNEDVNKEADDFIAQMNERLKLERIMSDMEYRDRIQRGAL